MQSQIIKRISTIPRNPRFDLFKAFAAIAIILRHLNIIPAWSFLWAIPLFLLVTSALYQDRLSSLRIRKFIGNIAWITGIIVFFTLLAYYLDIPHLRDAVLPTSVKEAIIFFYYRNPFLGNLWYFFLYMQQILLLILMNKLPRKILEKRSSGLIILIISLSFSHLLLATIGSGISINIISWTFIIWIGLFRYKQIQKYFSDLSKPSLTLILAFSIICLQVFIYGPWKEGFLEFISLRTHDFIFPTIILQFIYFVIIFSMTELIIRIFPQWIIKLITQVGRISVYYYIFHFAIINITRNMFIPKPVLVILILIFGRIIAYVLEKFRSYLYKFSKLLTPLNKKQL